MLHYADDLVILADSKRNLSRKITVLEEYCKENFLFVNTEKTKIVVFSRASYCRSNCVLTYNNEILEIVTKYA